LIEQAEARIASLEAAVTDSSFFKLGQVDQLKQYQMLDDERDILSSLYHRWEVLEDQQADA